MPIVSGWLRFYDLGPWVSSITSTEIKSGSTPLIGIGKWMPKKREHLKGTELLEYIRKHHSDGWFQAAQIGALMENLYDLYVEGKLDISKSNLGPANFKLRS